MIHAIVPIPMRYPIGYQLGSGFCKDGNCVEISGRPIVVLPLYFYKFFSTYGNCSYQHIFASDTCINPVTLDKAEHPAKVRDCYGGVFVPISVKRFDQLGSTTFLFSRCIDFLLRHYQPNVPLDETEIIEGKLGSMLSPGYRGVAAISEFNFQYLKSFMEHNAWLGITPERRLIMSAMTPELPDRIATYVNEIVGTHLYGEELAAYISDLCAYEMNKAVSMKEFLDSERYSFPLDPITKLCVCTPSYLYGHELRAFLGNELSLSSFSRIGYNPVDNQLTQIPLNFMFQSADPYTWSDELMEDLINMADEDFRLTISNTGPVMQSFSVVGNPAPTITNHLVQTVNQTLIDFRQVEIIKNWTDEIFITLWNDYGPQTYYLNLAWYHLMSPSLVNMNPVR